MVTKAPQLTTNGTAQLKVSEGVIPYVYDDAVFPTKPWKRGTRIKGNLTAGVGHLLSRGKTVFPEAEAWIGKDIPKAQIDRWLDADTDSAEQQVEDSVKVKLEPYQRDALILFCFNIGNGGFSGSTLVRKLNTGNYEAVPAELRKWTKTTINGKKVTSNGLVKRRADEINVWLGANAAAPLPAAKAKKVGSGTQIAERETPPITAAEILTGAGTVITGASGFATSEGIIAYAFGAALVIAVLVIGGIVVKRYFFNK